MFLNILCFFYYLISLKINNNNDCHIVKLPHIILRNILSKLNFVDQITLTLVCKNWYLERKKLLPTFSLNNHVLKDKVLKKYYFKNITLNECNYNFDNVHLQSYKSIFENSILPCQKDKLFSIKSNIKEDIDQIVIPKEYKRLSISLVNYKKFFKNIQQKDKNNGDNNINKSQQEINRLRDRKELFDQLKSLSIKIDYTCTIEEDEELPPNLEDLKAVVYERPVIFNQFPSTLKRVEISSRIVSHLKGLPNLRIIKLAPEEKYYLKPGDIPDQVTHLYFSRREVLTCIPAGCIPITIKYLRLGGLNYRLVTLNNVTPITSDDGATPSQTIYSKEHFFSEKHEFEYLNLGSLFFNSAITKINYLELLCKARTLVVTNYSYGELRISLPNDFLAHAQVENLTITLPLQHQAGLIPSTVRNLEIRNYGSWRKIDYGEIPNSVETLRFVHFRRLQDHEDIIPPSVRSVHFIEKNGKCNDNLRWSLQNLPKTVHSFFKNDIYQFKRIDNDHFLFIRSDLVKSKEPSNTDTTIDHGCYHYTCGIVNY